MSDFTTDNLTLKVREPEFMVHWSTNRGAYSMTYFDRDLAEEALAALAASTSIRYAGLYRGSECLQRHDYDPYAWHDGRKATGR